MTDKKEKEQRYFVPTTSTIKEEHPTIVGICEQPFTSSLPDTLKTFTNNEETSPSIVIIASLSQSPATMINGTITEEQRQLKLDAKSHKGMKLKSYSIEFKLEVVECAEQKSIHAAERLYKVDRKSIRSWRNSKQRLLELSASGTKGCSRKRLGGGGRKVINRQLEQRLLDWICGVVDRGEKVTGSMVIAHALWLQKERHIKDAVVLEGDRDKSGSYEVTASGNRNSAPKQHSLNFSRGWLEKFVLRNNLLSVVGGASAKQTLKNSTIQKLGGGVNIVATTKAQSHLPTIDSKYNTFQNANNFSMASSCLLEWEPVKTSLDFGPVKPLVHYEPTVTYKHNDMDMVQNQGQCIQARSPVDQPQVYILEEL